MAAPPGYDSEELTFAQRNPQTIMLSDGVRARKTDTGYIIEEMSSSGAWARIGGTFIPNVLVAGSDFDITSTNFSYYIDASGAQLQVSCHLQRGSGQMYLVVKIDGSVNAVTIAVDGSDLIDGAASLVLTDQYSDCYIQDFRCRILASDRCGIA